jgi:CMP/dCMP kinase
VMGIDSRSDRSKLVIAIDGPAAAGKSTVASILAARCGLFHFSVGGLHRANAWALNSSGSDFACEEALNDCMLGFTIHVEKVGEACHYFVDQVDVTDRIFSPQIGELASRLGLIGVVEQRVHALAHLIVDEKGRAVIDGRGLNSIFPRADIKIYMTAGLHQRALRYQELLLGQGIQSEVDELQALITTRDYRDQTRTKHPLVIAEDAIVIDTTVLSVQEVVDRVVTIIEEYECNYQ